VDSIQKHILRVYNEIFQFWNNQCIQYKVEWSDSIQKHILRVYIIKYSNLGTMNASSIRWSAAASKLEFYYVPLSCMQLLSCQACHSLPSISSPAPFLLLALIASLVPIGSEPIYFAPTKTGSDSAEPKV
jgi:hypothetical protein